VSSAQSLATQAQPHLKALASSAAEASAKAALTARQWYSENMSESAPQGRGHGAGPLYSEADDVSQEPKLIGHGAMIDSLGSGAESSASLWGHAWESNGLGAGALPKAMPEVTSEELHNAMSEAMPKATEQEAWTPRLAPAVQEYSEQFQTPQPLNPAGGEFSLQEQSGPLLNTLPPVSPVSLLQAAGLQQSLLPPPGLQHQAAQLLEDQRRRFLALDQRSAQVAAPRPPLSLGSFGSLSMPASIHSQPGPVLLGAIRRAPVGGKVACF